MSRRPLQPMFGSRKAERIMWRKMNGGAWWSNGRLQLRRNYLRRPRVWLFWRSPFDE